MSKYDEIISLGSNCDPGLSMRILKIKSETYPFDWVRSNTKIIFDLLQNGKNRYLSFGKKISGDFYLKNLHYYTNKNFKKSHVNYYGQHFTHYKNISTNELKNKFNRYIERFFSLLKSNKKILFIHTNEEYIYHGQTRRHRNILYNYLCKINDILEEKYPNLDFEIINIDINNRFSNYKKIINLNIVNKFPFSNNCEFHIAKIWNVYRNNVTKIIKNYLEKNKL